MFTLESFTCPDGITPNSNLTGPNKIYIYIVLFDPVSITWNDINDFGIQLVDRSCQSSFRFLQKFEFKDWHVIKSTNINSGPHKIPLIYSILMGVRWGLNFYRQSHNVMEKPNWTVLSWNPLDHAQLSVSKFCGCCYSPSPLSSWGWRICWLYLCLGVPLPSQDYFLAMGGNP